ncbi:MAG: hypothetical protein SGJ21_15550 [Alphaproteobacteria bacterium]|nr:hypothetical protein [Alphaproteobacteria bacterium]
MRRNLIAAMAAVILVVSLTNCTTKASQTQYSLVPVRTNGQDLNGMDSRTTVESRQPGGIVSVRADDQFAEFGAGFVVVVQNRSSIALEFGPQNIVASLNDKPLRVLAADELDAAVKSKLSGYLRATSRTDGQDFDTASVSANREYRFNNYGGCPAG